MLAAQIGDTVHTRTSSLTKHHELVIVLDKCHQSDILSHIEIAAEALELLGFILCFLTRYEIVIPQPGTAFHLGKMCFYAGKVSVYIVIYFESFLSG